MITDLDEKVCACALGHIFGYEPKYASELVIRLGSAREVFKLTRSEIEDLFGPYSKYAHLIGFDALEKAEAELKSLRDRGFQYVAFSEDAYPCLLKECEDPPAGLYIRSETPAENVFNGRPTVAVVGTRNISMYGREWCPKIIEALSCSEEPPVIVSGLALGVDISAHMAALAWHIPTVGVMATGIDRIYPYTHSTAAAKIASAPGSALVTDYPPGTMPVAINFLRRNRIIAGMSIATILVESAVKGGGMMTARLASGYGRDVYVLPGRIEDKNSGGCNLLLKEKLAEPITDLSLLPEMLGLGKFNRRNKKGLEAEIRSRYKEKVSPSEMEKLVKIALCVKSKRGVTVDELCGLCSLTYPEVSALTCLLESDSIIETDLVGRCILIFRG